MKKQTALSVVALVFAAALVATTACRKENEAKEGAIPAEGITLSLTTATLDLSKGEKVTLKVTFIPENATYTKVKWSSSNTDVATVSDGGEVTPVAAGTAVITARCLTVTATCTVLVTSGETPQPDPDTPTIPNAYVTAQSSITYGGETYKTVQLSNGMWIMAENLRYVPAGKEVSDNPADGNGVWYPCKLDTTTSPVTASADVEGVDTKGLLYDFATAFGVDTIQMEDADAENYYKNFEGTRGICPEGWHIPTVREWISVAGKANDRKDWSEGNTINSETFEVDANAVFYDEEYEGARLLTMEEAGSPWGFAGTVQRTNAEATGKYGTVSLKGSNCSVQEWWGENAVSYLMSSSWNVGKDAGNPKLQFFALMSTFTSTKYPEGRAHAAYTQSVYAGCSLRCVRDE